MVLAFLVLLDVKNVIMVFVVNVTVVIILLLLVHLVCLTVYCLVRHV